jgi:hypothetical protein
LWRRGFWGLAELTGSAGLAARALDFRGERNSVCTCGMKTQEVGCGIGDEGVAVEVERADKGLDL